MRGSPPPGYNRWLYLAGTPWWRLEGVPFEQALAETFRQLGYFAQPTARTGDGGVDLVLIAPCGSRIAVQAKGNPSGAKVGYSAVQEVFTGAALAQCHRAAVITNSRFTAPAYARARTLSVTRLPMTLIDGKTLPALTTGRIQL